MTATIFYVLAGLVLAAIIWGWGNHPEALQAADEQGDQEGRTLRLLIAGWCALIVMAWPIVLPYLALRALAQRGWKW
jgi:hypothetical protein